MAGKMAAKRLAAQKNKTRTHLFYEVHKGDVIEKKDIPFDIGVMADLRGDAEAKFDLDERDWVEVADPAKFDNLVENISPELNMEVEFGADGEEQLQAINLKFTGMEDFGPEAVLKELAKQVPSVKALKELREALVQARQSVNVSKEFEKTLKEMLSDPDKLAQLKSEIEKQN